MLRNLFVLGHSRAGKTSVAEKIAAELGWARVSASDWARAGYAAAALPDADPSTFVARITAWSMARLREDPDVCVTYVRSRHRLEDGGFVIEGIRNPRDFIHLSDPRHDAAVILHNGAVAGAATPFETGISVIASYLRWVHEAGWTDEERVFDCTFPGYEALPAAVASCLAFARSLT
jgi:hypothetical protein